MNELELAVLVLMGTQLLLQLDKESIILLRLCLHGAGNCLKRYAVSC